MPNPTSRNFHPQDPRAILREMEALGWVLTREGFQHPKQFQYGIVTSRAPDAEDVALCRAWIVTHAVRRKTFNRAGHSRHLANAAGQYFGQDLREGALIAAGIALGFAFRHEFHPENSAVFAMGLQLRLDPLKARYIYKPVTAWTRAALRGRQPLRRWPR